MSESKHDSAATVKGAANNSGTTVNKTELDAGVTVNETEPDAGVTVNETEPDRSSVGAKSENTAAGTVKKSGYHSETARAEIPARGKRTLWTLFKTCFVISSCTFGGGMVIISLLQKKFVEELRWIGQDEVMDMVAIAQSCPGVMAVNTSIIIGYRIAGVTGALLTVIGTVLPPMIILTIVSACYVQFRSNAVIALLLKGMQAGVAAVMLNVSISMVKSVVKEHSILAYVMLAGAVIAVMVFGIDIILVLLCCGVLGGAAVCLHRSAE